MQPCYAEGSRHENFDLSRMMKRILLIHPEGNINNNPNLSGLAEILCETGFDLHVVSLRIPGMYQQPPAPGVTMAGT